MEAEFGRTFPLDYARSAFLLRCGTSFHIVAGSKERHCVRTSGRTRPDIARPTRWLQRFMTSAVRLPFGRNHVFTANFASWRPSCVPCSSQVWEWMPLQNPGVLAFPGDFGPSGAARTNLETLVREDNLATRQKSPSRSHGSAHATPINFHRASFELEILRVR
jgi:hypothetical protein